MALYVLNNLNIGCQLSRGFEERMCQRSTSGVRKLLSQGEYRRVDALPNPRVNSRCSLPIFLLESHNRHTEQSYFPTVFSPSPYHYISAVRGFPNKPVELPCFNLVIPRCLVPLTVITGEEIDWHSSLLRLDRNMIRERRPHPSTTWHELYKVTSYNPSTDMSDCEALFCRGL